MLELIQQDNFSPGMVFNLQPFGTFYVKNDPPDQTNLAGIKHYLSSVEVPSVDYGQNPIILGERINKT